MEGYTHEMMTSESLLYSEGPTPTWARDRSVRYHGRAPKQMPLLIGGERGDRPSGRTSGDRTRAAYSVYVVELAPARAGGPTELYVGSTALTPEERVRHHLGRARAADGRAGSGRVRRRFRRLLPEFTAGPFRDRTSAKRAEQSVRRRLERDGYVVHGACRQGCPL